MSVLLVLLYAVCVLLLTMYLRFSWQYRHVLAVATKLPCPPTLPIIGNALLFFGDTVNVTKNLLKITTAFQGIFCVWIGPVPLFIVVDPADAQVILNSSSTLERDNVYSLFKTFLGNSLLSAPVHTWKRYRKLINPVLHPSNVEHFLPVFNEVGRKLTEQLSVSSPPSDRTDDMFDMALDASLRTVISRIPISDETKTDIKYVLDSIGRIFILRVFKVWLHVDWLFNLIYWKELKQAHKIMGKFMNTINQGCKEEETIRKEIIPDPNLGNAGLSGINLVDVMFDNLPLIVEDHDWRDEVTTMVAGASDTVVSCLNLLIFTLGHHPEIQDKIFMEIQEVMGDLDRDVTAGDVNGMTYLGQVILESLRLHGNIVGIMRKATKDTKLPGCTLPAGSRVAIMLHALGWNEEQFPKPELFLPERFSPEKQKERHNYSFLPFSAGPRNCIGKIYAMMLLKTALVHILRRLRVTSHTKLSDIEYELKVVMYSKTPLLVSFHPR
ncbi:cytochrome P450 4c21-like [Homalodisca vitripennis]|uniref:cytochrome P450 4c21-like n=1 Tax=Homalodisca vitripennis TaxID=197043 RepID=UPI001EECECF8|nr:cytochrome P450 4c21-like [Homalodisca vitripennis]XP_046678054.1 cytochrome P450 4c21-like [Homalodisca vitripennis]